MDLAKELYKKENNLFQSPEWLSFQERLQRKVIKFGKNDCFGIEVGLPINKKFIWIQKSPKEIKDLSEIKLLSNGAIFVRLEPSKRVGPLQGSDPSKANEAKRFNLFEVKETSLLSGQKSPKATRILDISKSEEQILAQMKSKTRYNIRLSAKKGVSVRISSELKDIDLFYDLLLETASKDKGYVPHEKAYYQKMIEVLGEKEIVKLFIAEFDGKPLAGILVSFYGEVATYLHGGSSINYRELMAPYLCQWEAMKYAKEKDCKYYDFWGVALKKSKIKNNISKIEEEIWEIDSNHPWAGITRFKEGFGGERVAFPGSFDLVLNSFWYNVLTIGSKLKHLLR